MASTDDSKAPEAKRPKLNPKRIGTHSGTFHCDEATAIFMLINHTKEFKDAEIVRTRDPEVWKTCDALVDVGGVYDYDTRRFDHHQKGFTENFGHGFETKLSSAGLIYKHYGKEIICSILGEAAPKDEATQQLFYLKIYENFMEAIDAVDNGISQYPTDIEPKYKGQATLSGRVSKLKPWWNATRPAEHATEDLWYMALFRRAVAMTGEALTQKVRHMGLAWWPARSIVMASYKGRFEYDAEGRVMVLNQFCPWKSHLEDIEEELDKEAKQRVLYALFQDQKGNWRIQGVPAAPGSFECRKFLPKPWRAMRDSELDKLVGTEGSIFVHASGFIGGHKTFEGAKKMAELAVRFEE